MAKDRLFIFVAIVLVILFAAQVFLNSPRPSQKAEAEPRLFQPRQEDMTEILTRLEQAGLEPREAKYYRGIQ